MIILSFYRRTQRLVLSLPPPPPSSSCRCYHWSAPMQVLQDEHSVGISQHTCQELSGFSGILKQRYSDFIVREIDTNGSVAHLVRLNAKEFEEEVFQDGSAGEIMSSEEVLEELLQSLCALTELSDDNQQQLRDFVSLSLSRDVNCPKSFLAFPCEVKETRTAAHKAVRASAASFLESESVKVDGVQYFQLLAKHKQQKGKKRRRDQWPAGVGDYLKFKIMKENVDTMSAVNYMSGVMRCKKDFLKFAGTKDKRAITVQWVTAYRMRPMNFHRFNTFRYPPLIRCGDFEYVKEPLQLGNLRGNRFEIVLREVSCTAEHLDLSCQALNERGFINYFGLQRFGKGGAGNHLIGRALLQCNWKEAIDYMFAPKEGDREEVSVMKQRYAEGDYAKARESIPGSSYYSEKYCLQGLCSSPNDFLGAFQRIPRSTKFICGHAFQSYIWNMAASERVSALGLHVAAGDLVLLSDVDTEDFPADDVFAMTEGDEKVSSISGGASEDINQSVHIVTEDDIASNRFETTDVVLPLVGFNSLLPRNKIGSYIEDLLNENNIELELFRKHPVFQFSGGYRRVFSRPGNFEWSSVAYSERNSDILSTELQEFQVGGRKGVDSVKEDTSVELVESVVSDQNTKEEEAPLKYLAAVLKFSLPAGVYATMLLREIMKTSTETGYHANLTSLSRESESNSVVAATSCDSSVTNAI